MKLSILIPHYKETAEVIKPLLDSIALQQSVDLQLTHLPSTVSKPTIRMTFRKPIRLQFIRFGKSIKAFRLLAIPVWTLQKVIT